MPLDNTPGLQLVARRGLRSPGTVPLARSLPMPGELEGTSGSTRKASVPGWLQEPRWVALSSMRGQGFRCPRVPRCLGQATAGTASGGLSWPGGSGFPLAPLSLPGCFVDTGNSDGEG